jgi:hypothetical protein
MTLLLSIRHFRDNEDRPLLQLIPRPGRMRWHRDGDRTGHLGGLDEAVDHAVVLAREVVGGHGRKLPAVIVRSGETPRGYLCRVFSSLIDDGGSLYSYGPCSR